jgi:hypothetical protein
MHTFITAGESRIEPGKARFAVRIFAKGAECVRDGHISIPDGSRYDICLTNNKRQRADAIIEIDGVGIGLYRIEGNSTMTINRSALSTRQFVCAKKSESDPGAKTTIDANSVSHIKVLFQAEHKTKRRLCANKSHAAGLAGIFDEECFVNMKTHFEGVETTNDDETDSTPARFTFDFKEQKWTKLDQKPPNDVAYSPLQNPVVQHATYIQRGVADTIHHDGVCVSTQKSKLDDASHSSESKEITCSSTPQKGETEQRFMTTQVLQAVDPNFSAIIQFRLEAREAQTPLALTRELAVDLPASVLCIKECK